MSDNRYYCVNNSRNSNELLLTMLSANSDNGPGRQGSAPGDVGSTLGDDKNKFQLTIDVQNFDHENITIKTADGFIFIDGKHGEKEDEKGFVSRQFTRKYIFPEDCDPDTVQSKISDGVLTVTANRKSALVEERQAPIAETGPN